MLFRSQFAKSLGLPGGFRDVGVPREALADLAEATLFDGSVIYNARPVTSTEEALPVWEAAWAGEG